VFIGFLSVIFLGITIGRFSVFGVIPLNDLLLSIGILILLFFLGLVDAKDISPLQRILVYLTIFAGFLGPAFFSFSLGSIHLFPYRIFLFLLWFLFLWDFFITKGQKLNMSHIKTKIYLQFLFFWFIYAVVSTVWAADKYAAIREIIFLFMAFSLIFFIVYYFNNYKYLYRFYLLWILVLAALIPIGILEVTTGYHLSVSKFVHTTKPQFMFLPTTVFYNPNDFATYLSLSLPFSLTFMRYQSGIFRRLIGATLFFLGIFLLISTRSRANYFAFLIGIAFWLLFLLKGSDKLKVSVAIILIVSLLFMVFPSKINASLELVINQFKSIFEELSHQGLSSLSIRINLLRNALFFVYSTFGLGVGAGNSMYYIENFRIYETGGILNLHNWWMEVLTHYGVIVFVLYLIFFLGIFFNLYHIYRNLNTSGEKMICEALLLGLVSFPFSSLSSSSIMSLKPHWLFFAFSLAFLNYQRFKSERK
jgi:teichuronic acid biosynthesis protein TuaE